MRCDVVVAGAGPAGSAAAYWLARTGADVLFVDRAHFPRDKPCGDGLTPRAVAALCAMALGDVVLAQGRPFAGVRISYPAFGSTPVELPGGGDGRPGQGIILGRRYLDDVVRQGAIRAGARFLPGFAARAPHYRDGRLAGLEGQQCGQPFIIHADLLVVATGANRALLQALQIADINRADGLALRTYLSNVSDLDDHLEIHVDRDLLPGYAWVFPAGARLANVGAGIRLDGLTPADAGRRLRAAFDAFAGSGRLAGAHTLAPPIASLLRTDFPAIPTSGLGYLVVGEAAGLVNPLTGEGIALALESGQIAAAICAEALSSGDPSARGLARYDEILRARYGSYFRDARELMARLQHPRVFESVLQHVMAGDAAREALSSAVLDEQPRRSIEVLGTLLSTNGCDPLVCLLFALNAYRPLLDRCRAYLLAQVSLDTPVPALLALLARGKMLRALLVFLGCQAAGGDPDQVLTAAAGIELVHAASLVHDDIMDDARERRGLPAVHRSEGTPRAIVCGDYLIAKSFRLLAESRTQNPASNVVEAFIIGAQSGIQTCASQYHDLGPYGSDMFSEESYHRLVAGKTAAAIAGALLAGAALAGCDPALSILLGQYGDCVGRAFQIRDDVLDFTAMAAGRGEADRTVTLILAHAYEHAEPETRVLIEDFCCGKDVPAQELAALVQASRSLAYAERVARCLVDEAVSLSTRISHVGETLAAFARYALLREN